MLAYSYVKIRQQMPDPSSSQMFGSEPAENSLPMGAPLFQVPTCWAPSTRTAAQRGRRRSRPRHSVSWPPSRPARPQVTLVAAACRGRFLPCVANLCPSRRGRAVQAVTCSDLSGHWRATGSCPAGSARIATAAACQTAASATRLSFGSSASDSNYPAGYYRWIGDGLAYFNQHTAGGGEADGQPLCRGLGRCAPRAATLRPDAPPLACV
jgi:hypothetical protein